MTGTTDEADEGKLPSLEQALEACSTQRSALRKRLIPELGKKDIPDAKVLWKALVLQQCLIRRTLELVDGIERAAGNHEYLISTLLARALIETMAVAWSITVGIEQGISDKNLAKLDKLLMDRSFATRLPNLLEVGLPSAANVLSLIEKFERDLAVRTGEDVPKERDAVSAHYDLLSDFAHPNYLGVSRLYGDLDKEARLMRFGEPRASDRLRISRGLGVSMTAILIIEGCQRKMDQMIEPLRELNKAGR